LELGQSGEEICKKPTDLRIAQYDGKKDPELAKLYFQFGRYLMISSSRQGCQPSNLQGLWNDEEWPLWGSKYTININTQMNYWPAETCNLAECYEPFYNLMDDLHVTGAETAKRHYGCNGYVVHHNTDIWRAAAPVDCVAGVWPLGAAWMAQHLWEHYEFSNDIEFLKNRCYPVLKDSAKFLLEYMTEAPKGSKFEGKLVTIPSFSPENFYIDNAGKKGYLTISSTMDIQLINDLFGKCIKALTILGVDFEFKEILSDTLKKLPSMQIGKHGQLQEWIEDLDRAEDHNGHVSHLYGLYPGNQINRYDHPTLAQAVKKSLELRGFECGGGWPSAWRAALYAHLGDGEKAGMFFDQLIINGANPNMLNLRPPFPMQIDGNFGGTAAISEMLVQSRIVEENGEEVIEICLLPALPGQWKCGFVKGLRIRGGFEIDLSWTEGIVGQVSIRPIHDKNFVHRKLRII
jgi:alpha-L-fucosidase 2